VEVEAFEREFAAYCGAERTVGVSSGTEALALALRGLGIGPGDEVIVPANSFIATAEAVTLAGATPLPVDVDPVREVIDADGVAAALTARTRCVVPVHLHGRTVEMDPLMELARGHGLRVVEDACQAHGAIYRGRRVGSIGDAAR
jgi:dTDP-3-amino-3,4,6-trideoxy-alpha-D-glucose transaminase